MAATTITADYSLDVYSNTVKVTVVSARTTLLFVPLFIEQVDNEYRITPLSAPVNARDVTMTRLGGITNAALLTNSLSHISYGCYSSSKTPHKLSPTFNRDVQVSKNIFYTSSINFDSTKVIISGFLECALSPHTCINQLNWVGVQTTLNGWNSQNCNATDLISFFTTLLDLAFDKFKTVECYKKLNAAATLYLSKHTTSRPYCHLLQSNGNICLPYVEVEATRKFQQCVQSIMAAIHDGQHRSMMVMMDTFGFDHDNFVSDHNCFVLPTEVATPERREWKIQEIPNVVYQTHTHIAGHGSDMCTTEQLQQISSLENQRITLTVEEERCHTLVKNCRDTLLAVARPDNQKIIEVEHNLTQYLKFATPSDSQNAKRKASSKRKASTLIDMRVGKQLLREIMNQVLLPPQQSQKVDCTYVMGISILEKKLTKTKKEASEKKSKNKSTKEFCPPPFFLILDCVSVFEDLAVFADLLQRSYGGAWSEQSRIRNLSHSELWNSDIIWLDMASFMWSLIDLLKHYEPAFDILEENMSNALKSLPKKHKTLLKQKISHSCQQFTFSISMAIIDAIGLFPDIPNTDWVAQEDLPSSLDFHSYNVFAYLKGLLLSKNDDDTTGDHISLTTTVRVFMEDVLIKYWGPLFQIAAFDLDEEDSGEELSNISISLKYSDFCRLGFKDDVVRCFEKLKNSAVEFNAKFFSGVGMEAVKTYVTAMLFICIFRLLSALL